MLNRRFQQGVGIMAEEKYRWLQISEGQ